MMFTIPDKTRLLRDEAWLSVMESEAYLAFKALDDAYVRMGGASRIADDDPNGISSLAKQAFKTIARRIPDHRKLSHAEAAEIVLRTFGEPLPTPQLLDAAKEAGAEIGGSDPLNNFRSTISKDDRFYSIKKGSTSYWWIKGESLPPEWNDPAHPSLPDEYAGSLIHNQEGGDGHAPPTT